jgi:hypothetical protein
MGESVVAVQIGSSSKQVRMVAVYRMVCTCSMPLSDLM